MKPIFPPKAISFKNALRLIRNYLLTKRVEYTKDGLQEDMEKLLMQIKKQVIKSRPGRKYSRRVKEGRYRKYK
jgi:hypothetical protein